MNDRPEYQRNDPRSDPDALEDTATRPLPGPVTGPVTGGTAALPEEPATRTGTAVQDAPREDVARDDVAPAPVRRPIRMRGVVLGIVLLTVAIVANLRIVTDLQLHTGTVVLALMIGCGVLLIVGASRRE